jgi:hypothetical protein
MKPTKQKSLLFEDAKAKLDKIDAQTQKEKKQIVKILQIILRERFLHILYPSR